MAEQYYVRKSYSSAEQLYEEVMPYFRNQKNLKTYITSMLIVHGTRKIMRMQKIFLKVFGDFPNSPRAEEMDFMRAKCFFKQSPKPELDQTNTIKAMGPCKHLLIPIPDHQIIKRQMI